MSKYGWDCSAANTTNLPPLTAHIYHVMITVTSDFSKTFFFIIPRNSFEGSQNYFLGI